MTPDPDACEWCGSRDPYECERGCGCPDCLSTPEED
jgi:hypothetical protein